MKKVIVSGADGFLGKALIQYLLEKDVEIIALVREKSNSGLKNTSRVKLVNYELSQSEKLHEKIDKDTYDAFYHFAWVGSAGEKRCDTRLQLNNAQWTIETLRAAKAIGCKRFVCAGSIMEEETLTAAYTDNSRPGLPYIYGGAKVTAHIMAMSVAADIGIDLVWAKITNAYGPGETSPRMLNTTIRKIINQEPLEFTSATQNYDFVYIDDVARAFYLIGKNGRPFNEYIIGSSQARPLREFLIEMKDSIAPDVEMHFGNVPFTGINLPLESFSAKKTEDDTGFKAAVSFAEGTKRTMNWIMSQ